MNEVEEQPCPDCDDRGYTVRSDPRDPTGNTPEQVQCQGPKHWVAAIQGDELDAEELHPNAEWNKFDD